MTQQVIHSIVKLKSNDAEVDNPSFGFTFEATGSNPNFTFDDTSPVAALLWLLSGNSSSYTNNTSVVPPSANWGKWIGGVISRTAGDLVVETYDVTAFLNGAPHGSPLRIDSDTLAGATDSTHSLPEGCAVGIAWRAPYGSATEFAPGARPRARYRNRCYFGPLINTTDSITSVGTHASRVGASLLTDIDNGMIVLATNNTTVGTSAKQWDLVAWSRKDAMVRDAEFWARSERFDYQRRRTERLTPETWQAFS